jgi:hypothetical protein
MKNAVSVFLTGVETQKAAPNSSGCHYRYLMATGKVSESYFKIKELQNENMRNTPR